MFLQKTIAYLSAGAPFWESIAVWYENSFLRQLLINLEENYFSVNFHVYEHIGIGPGDNESARFLIFGIALGLILASILTTYTRTKLGGFLQKLIKNDATSPENAMTLHELGEFRNASVRRALAKGVTLGKLVRCREREALHPISETEKKSTDDTNQSNDDNIEISAPDATTLIENDAIVAENSNTVCENDATVAENSDTVCENGATVAENSDTVCENGATVVENSDTVCKNNANEKDSAKAASSDDDASTSEKIGFWKRLKRFFLGEEEKEKIDFQTAHFYIPEELKHRAEVRFDRRGSGWLFTALTVILCVVATALLCRFLPDIVQLMDNIIGMMAP